MRSGEYGDPVYIARGDETGRARRFLERISEGELTLHWTDKFPEENVYGGIRNEVGQEGMDLPDDWGYRLEVYSFGEGYASGFNAVFSRDLPRSWQERILSLITSDEREEGVMASGVREDLRPEDLWSEARDFGIAEEPREIGRLYPVL